MIYAINKHQRLKEGLSGCPRQQNVWRTINSYYEVVQVDNQLLRRIFSHQNYYLKAFISEVTVRVEIFYYSGELPLVG